MQVDGTAQADGYDDFRDVVILATLQAIGLPRLLPGEYLNPFCFLTEFDQWFEFGRRIAFERESSAAVIAGMLADDIARAARSLDVNRTTISRACQRDFGRVVYSMGPFCYGTLTS